jgi:DNA-binding XRE family transcriptional regulator
MKEGSKYYPLFVFLQRSNQDRLELNLAQIQTILDGHLPSQARLSSAWWSNRHGGSVQAAAWMEAGYLVDDLDLQNGHVTFRKQGVFAGRPVRRAGQDIFWNGSMIKALREHMDLTQAEFARELGVRQPTISEWETGAYEPKRSTSKLLTLVAEEAGFKYE